jgi:FixJ family two-component response regulator
MAAPPFLSVVDDAVDCLYKPFAESALLGAVNAALGGSV